MRLWKTVSCLPQRKWRVGFCWFWLPLVWYVGAPAAFKTSFLWEKGKYSKHRSDFMTFLYRTSSTTYRLPTSNRALGRNRSSRRTSALALPQIFFFDLFLALRVFITWTAVFPHLFPRHLAVELLCAYVCKFLPFAWKICAVPLSKHLHLQVILDSNCKQMN